ncbi:MAG: hypothetical protein M5U19_04405 [Microthrixaceae bacterium]|nr:hypothetical protein [Microthrixaceae bacterium]
MVSAKSVDVLGGFNDDYTALTQLTASTAEGDTTRVTAGRAALACSAVGCERQHRDQHPQHQWADQRPQPGGSPDRRLGVHIHLRCRGARQRQSGRLHTVRVVGGNSSRNPTGLLVYGASSVTVPTRGSRVVRRTPARRGSGAYGGVRLRGRPWVCRPPT